MSTAGSWVSPIARASERRTWSRRGSSGAGFALGRTIMFLSIVMAPSATASAAASRPAESAHEASSIALPQIVRDQPLLALTVSDAVADRDRAVAQGALQRQHRGGAITSQCCGPILLFDEALPGDAEGLDGTRRQCRRFRGRDTVQHHERGGQRMVVRNAEIDGARKLQQASEVLALTPKLLANG